VTSKKEHIRPCMSCWGSGLEQLAPDLVARVALAVREEVYPKLKAVEHTGKGGTDLFGSLAEAIRANRAKRLQSDA